MPGFSISISSKNIDDRIRTFELLPAKIKESKRSGLSSVGFVMMNEVRDWIETEGKGTWPGSSEVVRLWLKKYRRGGPFRKRRGRYRGAYHFLGKFARYRIVRSNSVLLVGFGTFSARDIRKGKPARFARPLERIGARIQKPRRERVTAKTRGLFGAQRTKERQRPGRDIFPLRSETTSIEVKARPITGPVWRRTSSRIPRVFEEKFGKAIERRYEKL